MDSNFKYDNLKLITKFVRNYGKKIKNELRNELDTQPTILDDSKLEHYSSIVNAYGISIVIELTTNEPAVIKSHDDVMALKSNVAAIYTLLIIALLVTVIDDVLTDVNVIVELLIKLTNIITYTANQLYGSIRNAKENMD